MKNGINKDLWWMGKCTAPLLIGAPAKWKKTTKRNKVMEGDIAWHVLARDKGKRWHNLLSLDLRNWFSKRRSVPLRHSRSQRDTFHLKRSEFIGLQVWVSVMQATESSWQFGLHRSRQGGSSEHAGRGGYSVTWRTVGGGTWAVLWPGPRELVKTNADAKLICSAQILSRGHRVCGQCQRLRWGRFRRRCYTRAKYTFCKLHTHSASHFHRSTPIRLVNPARSPSCRR